MPMSIPVAGSPWTFDSNPFPGGAGGHVLLNASARGGRAGLTSAGFLATLNQIYTYLNTSSAGVTIGRLNSRGIGLYVHVEAGQFSYPVLKADVAAQVAAFATILRVAANIAA